MSLEIILLNTVALLSGAILVVFVTLVGCVLGKTIKRASHVIRGASALYDLLKDPKIAKTIEKHSDQIKAYILQIHEYHAK